MKKLLVVLLACTATSLSAQTSRTFSTRNLFWAAASLTWKFNPQWTFMSDALFRFEYTDGDLFQSGIRSGIAYTTPCGIQLAGGGAFFLHYPNPNTKVPRPEIRAWQEAGRKFDFGIHHTLFPRIRLEQRFFEQYEGDQLADHHFSLHSWRLRLRVDYTWTPGTRNNAWSLLLGDEFMVQRRDNGFTSVDQNRAWAGAGYKLNETVALQLTYIHILQQRTRVFFDQLHVIRLTVQLTLKKATAN